MKYVIVILFLTFISSTIIPLAHAQQSTFEFKKSSSQYSVTGSITISKATNGYTYTALVQNLPTTKPAGGMYYIMWGLTYEGKATNLGTINNTSANSGSLTTKIKQFFISSEKEQFPEFVTGPRIAQTDILPETVFAQSTPSASPYPSPKTSPTSTPRATPTTSQPPIGGPTGAPETGLGGAILWNGLIYSLGALGLSGLTVSLYNKAKKK